MNVKLVDLLRYKTEVSIKVRGKKVTTKWVRIIGDSDIQEAYKLGRIASAKMRKELKNSESIDYQDRIAVIDDTSKEECIEAIIVSTRRTFEADADANVERPDLPELDEIAEDADAATLEEQEKFDVAITKVEAEYLKAKEDYVNDRSDVLKAELEGLSIEDVRKRAKEETINTVALTTFLLEVQAEKVWRSVYTDKSCTEKEFSGIAEFKDTSDVIRQQLYDAYSKLEINGDDIKN